MVARTHGRIRSPQVVLVSAVCGLCLSAPVPAAATDGGSPVRLTPTGDRIQEAIDHAKDGDEIILAPGIYRERLDFRGKAITLRSAAGATQTLIDGGPVGPDDPGGSTIVMRSGEGPTSRIEGLSIVGGRGAARSRGGGLLLDGTSPTIVQCLILNNQAEVGGAVSSTGGTPVFRQCWFYRNTSTGGGATVECDGSRPRFLGCGFHGEGVQWINTAALNIASECDEGGACCLGAVCIVASNQACLDAGGRWRGTGIGCQTDLCPAPCPADSNEDGRVNMTDLLAVLESWGRCPTRAGPGGRAAEPIETLRAPLQSGRR